MARGNMSYGALEAALTALGAEVSKDAKQALLTGGETILADAKSKITNVTGKSRGDLAASGKVKANKKGNKVTISFDAEAQSDDYPYSKIVEFRPGHEHPFLYPAYDAHRDKIKENVIDSIRKAVQSRGVS